MKAIHPLKGRVGNAQHRIVSTRSTVCYISNRPPIFSASVTTTAQSLRSVFAIFFWDDSSKKILLLISFGAVDSLFSLPPPCLGCVPLGMTGSGSVIQGMTVSKEAMQNLCLTDLYITKVQ